MRLTTKLIRHILMPAVILAVFMGLTYRYYNLQHARAAVAADLARTGQIITQLLNYRVNENEQELGGFNHDSSTLADPGNAVVPTLEPLRHEDVPVAVRRGRSTGRGRGLRGA